MSGQGGQGVDEPVVRSAQQTHRQPKEDVRVEGLLTLGALEG